jgi:hypothetical protein
MNDMTRNMKFSSNYDTTDIYCAPVATADGVVVGILQVLNRMPPFTQDDYEFLKPLPAKSAPF